MKTVFVLIISLILFTGFTNAENLDTAKVEQKKGDSVSLDSTGNVYLRPPSQELLDDPDLLEPERYNPVVSAGLSLALPGIGQLYCRRTFRGFFYMASEAIAATYMFNRIYVYNKYSSVELDDWSNNVTHYNELLKIYVSTPKFDEYYDSLMTAHMAYDLAKHRQTKDRYIIYQSIGWAAGVYLWNISDAVNCSRAFHDNEPRDPGKALALSAIPFLGLGQIYNGSLSKAGLIWTFHSMWAYMAWNNNRLMNNCLEKRNQVLNATGVAESIKNDYYSYWSGEYDIAFSKRNSYLWYLIIFWFYGMFDAAIDAHLHDYQTKIRLVPEIEAKDETLGLKMHVNF